MKILISSSQNENIDEKYKESAHKLTEFLASEGNTLVWGSGCRSIMGICYEEFAKKDCEILGYTTPKYVDEIDVLPNGIDLTKFNSYIGEDLFSHFMQDAEPHIKNGSLIMEKDRIRFTEDGLFTSDNIISSLFLLQ